MSELWDRWGPTRTPCGIIAPNFDNTIIMLLGPIGTILSTYKNVKTAYK